MFFIHPKGPSHFAAINFLRTFSLRMALPWGNKNTRRWQTLISKTKLKITDLQCFTIETNCLFQKMATKEINVHFLMY